MKIVKKLASWAGHRLTEGSTYTGLATILGVIGLQSAGLAVGQLGNALIALGIAGMAATTKTPDVPAS